MLVWVPLSLTQRLEIKRNSLNWGEGRPATFAAGDQPTRDAQGTLVTHHPSPRQGGTLGPPPLPKLPAPQRPQRRMGLPAHASLIALEPKDGRG